MKIQNAILALLISAGCGDALFDLKNAIQKFGYIAYTTPVQYAGTGTLVSGDAAHLDILSGPESCFPSTIDVDGEPTLLRRVDNTTLPNQAKTFSIDVAAMANFFTMMQVGTPSIKASAHIQDLKSFTFSFNGAHIEYIDVIALQSYYPTMKQSCKNYLNLVGFIIQALRIESMTFTFYEKNDSNVAVEVDKIQQYLDIATDISWHVENKVNLVVDSPKYIGYQLGSLRQEDNGISLYRANSTISDQFIFKKITDIPTSSNLLSIDRSNLEPQEQRALLPAPRHPLRARYRE